ncbi:hypothetical protein [Agaribacterium haliotis]|uniref:hypothetical protein n=1 Tax=Agaribacterium haliotis TaxID=2013869 RepID=UPI000BB55D1C|nr:hypothetical protein [Agaribacterium haliotis]
MDIIYGVLALLSAMLVSSYFEKKVMPLSKKIAAASAVQLVFLLLLGGLWSFLGWGFFAELNSVEDKIKRVVGLSVFVAFLVGMKTWNKSRIREQ